jgi:hypothetical protein
MCLYFGGNDFLGLINSFSRRSIFLHQYESLLLVGREGRMSLLRLGLTFLSFLFFLPCFSFVACRGLVFDLEYKQCDTCSLCLLFLFCSFRVVC